MGRGTLYQLSTDVERVFPGIDEADFYDQAGYETEYFRNDSVEDSNDRIEELVALLDKIGATTGKVIGKEEPITWFVLNDNAKYNYFRPMYENFRKNIEKLNLENFCSANYSYELITSIQDDYGDAVVINNSSYIQPFDAFFRDAVMGQKYYIGPKTIYMK